MALISLISAPWFPSFSDIACLRILLILLLLLIRVVVLSLYLSFSMDDDDDECCLLGGANNLSLARFFPLFQPLQKWTCGHVDEKVERKKGKI